MYLLNQEKPWYLSDEWYVTVEEFDAIRRMNFPKDFIDFFDLAKIDQFIKKHSYKGIRDEDMLNIKDHMNAVRKILDSYEQE